MAGQPITRRLLATLAGAIALAASIASAQTPAPLPPAWDAVRYFRYSIENVVVTPATPAWKVRVIFSVTNPVTGGTWNVLGDLPFTSAGAGLTLDIGWDATTDFTNTGSANASLLPVPATTLGPGPAIPVQVRGLNSQSTATGIRAGLAKPCADMLQCPGVPSVAGRFWYEATVTPVAWPAGTAVKTGRVALEGKAVCNGIAGFACPTSVAPFAVVPVASEVKTFAFTTTQSLAAIIPDPRRPVVDIAKCRQCHDGKQHGDVVIPRLSLHGNNRTENLGLCIMCHNPNQTDVPYRFQPPTGSTVDPRVAGREVAIDFKVLVHAIHAGGFRETPYVVIGFQSSVNDFSDVRFPRELRNCASCHIDANGKGTFELPVKSKLGTTVTTQSNYLPLPGTDRTMNVNPDDDDRVTPTAAACSACHDKAEVRSHMVRTGGASFATKQANIGATVNERCASCHGPGKSEDVRRAHEVDGDDD